MIVTGYCILEPRGDRPYFSSTPPPDTLSKKPGVRVYRLEFQVEDWPVVTGDVVPKVEKVD